MPLVRVEMGRSQCPSDPTSQSSLHVSILIPSIIFLLPRTVGDGRQLGQHHVPWTCCSLSTLLPTPYVVPIRCARSLNHFFHSCITFPTPTALPLPLRPATSTAHVTTVIVMGLHKLTPPAWRRNGMLAVLFQSDISISSAGEH
jgi:hypothetical protein